MRRLKNFDSVVAGLMPTEDKNFTVTPPRLFQRERLRHLVEFVIPEQTRHRPDYLHAGECEYLWRDILWDLSLKVLKGEGTPGFIISAFREHSRKLGVIADTLAASGGKVNLDAYGDELLKRMTAIDILAPVVGDKDNSRDRAGRYLSAVLGLQSSKLEDYVGRMVGRLPQLDPTDVASRLTKFLDFAGTGRGAPLPYTSYVFELSKNSAIERAIAACYSPSLEAVATDGAVRPNLYEDGYALAVAYLGYLHHTKTPEAYDAILNPRVDGQPHNAKMYKQMTTARRFALLFAGLSAAPEMADLHIGLRLIKNSYDFLSPLVTAETSAIRDFHADLSVVERILGEFTFAPVATHCDYIFDAVAKVSEADVLLPIFLDTYLRFPQVTNPPTVKAPQGTLNFSAGVWSNKWVTPEILNDFMLHCRTVSSAARFAVEDVQAQLTYFYTMSLDSLGNEMQLPSDLLTNTSGAIENASAMAFQSVFEKEFFPLRFPRYKYAAADKREGQPTLLQYVNTPIYLTKLRADLRRNKPSFVFNPIAPMPVAASLGYKFAICPLPFNYTKECAYASTPNQAPEVTLLMRNALLFSQPVARYFDDAITLIAFHPFQARSVLDSLASICFVYDAKDQLWLEPGIPVVYGVPLKAFMDKNVRDRSSGLTIGDGPLWKKIEVSDPIDPSLRKIYWIKLHSFVPAPGPITRLPYTLTNGATLNISVLASVVPLVVPTKETPETGMVASAISGFYPNFPFIDTLRTTSLGVIKDLVAWEKVTAWSNMFIPYPHLFPETQQSFESWLTLDDATNLETFLNRKISRRFQTGGTSIVINVSSDWHVVFPEHDDVMQTMDESVPTISIEGDKSVSTAPAAANPGSAAPAPVITHPDRVVPVAANSEGTGTNLGSPTAEIDTKVPADTGIQAEQMKKMTTTAGTSFDPSRGAGTPESRQDDDVVYAALATNPSAPGDIATHKPAANPKRSDTTGKETKDPLTGDADFDTDASASDPELKFKRKKK